MSYAALIGTISGVRRGRVRKPLEIGERVFEGSLKDAYVVLCIALML